MHLLDVNMLLARADPMLAHHQTAHRWFVAVGRSA
jgi:hypothetical protein